MCRTGKFFSLIVLSLSLFPYCMAQETSDLTTIRLQELSDTLDKEKVKLFLSKIDEEIGEIAEQYPQLARWNVERKGDVWFSPGKRIDQNSLEYSYAMSKPEPGSKRTDWFEANGCHIRVRVLTIKQFSYLAGMNNMVVIWGEPFAGGKVIAEFDTAHPEAPELKQKFIEIIKEHLETAALK